MDDPDQTAPVPRDDGAVPPVRPTEREKKEMATGNGRAVPPEPAIDPKKLNAANDG
ncbi:hypothetical protein [Phreatobacter aquaticus]|uniref:hypothetical protein n=1 Tax=Phreatobacter aquaticus TaxID=2570229 RepID=UPI00143D5E82|nr:hypothetical protein [Phreatobacter aquaticus]